MRFLFTMNMPSRNGHAVHQVIGAHESRDLAELLTNIAKSDFITVEEFYVDRDSNGQSKLVSVGTVALNPMFIGKIKVSEDQPPRRGPSR